MPTYMKIAITVLVLVVACIAHFVFQADPRGAINQWVVLALGAMMIFALWLFPETKKRPGTRSV